MNSDGWDPSPRNNGCTDRHCTSLPDVSTAVADDDDRKSSEYSLASCQILRADQGAHYWQVQYYADTLTLESSARNPGTSSFAQTLKEADEVFYATFPDARLSSGRQWSPLPIGDSSHFEGTGFCMLHSPVSPQNFHPQCDEPTITVPAVGFTSELLAAIRPSDGSSVDRNDRTKLLIYSQVPESDDEPMHSVQHLSYTDHELGQVNVPPIPSREMSVDGASDIGFYEAAAVLAPQDSQVLDVEPPMACLSPPPPDEDDPLSSSHDTAGGLVSMPVEEEYSPIQDLNLIPSKAGTWPSVRVRSQSQQDSSSSPSSPTSIKSPNEAMTLTSFGRRSSVLSSPSPAAASSSIPSPSSPAGNTNASGPSAAEAPAGPSVRRLSPLPFHRRPIEKKKTQTLACNFCRHRKIACGPPLAGTTERTCNQCQRRSLECVFPTESRRGMRKKKAQPGPKSPSSPDLTTNTNQSAKSEQKSGSEPAPRPQEDG